MKLINADDLTKLIADFHYNKIGKFTDEQISVLDLVEKIINEQPPVEMEVAEQFYFEQGYEQAIQDIRRFEKQNMGHWIDISRRFQIIKCSSCKRIQPYNLIHEKQCPNCGVFMDLSKTVRRTDDE